MDLKELLGEDLYNQVSEKLGEHKVAVVSDGSYIPKQKFDDKNDELKELKSQLKERDTQLEDLSEKAKGHEELSRELEEAKRQNQEATQALQQKLDQKTFDFNLEKSLLSAKARNPKAVKALLDTDTIKLAEDESIIGLDEQLTKLQESDPYLFDIETAPAEPPKPNRYAPGTPKSNRGAGDEDLYSQAQEEFKKRFKK